MNKKFTKVFSLLLAAMLLLTACGGAKTTTATDSEDKIYCEERGLIFNIPMKYQDMGLYPFVATENSKGYKNIQVLYIGTEALQYGNEADDLAPIDENNEKRAELYQKFWDLSRCMMEVVMVEEDEYNQAMANGGKAEDFTAFTPAEYYKSNDGYAYIIATPELSTDGLNEEDAKTYKTLLEYMPTVKKNMQFTAVGVPVRTTTGGDTMPDFKTVDLNGNEVTKDVFQSKMLTVVNFWGTSCGPCIQEMPELEALAQKYADKVQFLGIVTDIMDTEDAKHIEHANLIIEKSGVTYPNLIPNETFKGTLQGIYGTPTTIFVDPTGNIIGEPIVGQDVPAVEAFIQSVIR